MGMILMGRTVGLGMMVVWSCRCSCVAVKWIWISDDDNCCCCCYFLSVSVSILVTRYDSSGGKHLIHHLKVTLTCSYGMYNFFLNPETSFWNLFWS